MAVQLKLKIYMIKLMAAEFASKNLNLAMKKNFCPKKGIFVHKNEFLPIKKSI